MGIKEEKWSRSISTLEKIATDLYKDKNKEKFYKIIETLEDLGIENLTLADIRTFIKKQTGIKVNFNDDYIFTYIMNPENMEELIRFGQAKFPIDTKDNDYSQKLNNLKSRRVSRVYR